jgi:iron complex outermembrane receptor protein
LDKFNGTRTLTGQLGAPGQNNTAMILVEEGQKIGQIVAAQFTGDVVNGVPQYADINGDGNTDPSQTDQVIDNLGEAGDLTIVGNGIPDFELGWTNQIKYKNWDFNAFFRGAFGHSLINTWRAFYEPRVSSQGSYNYINTKYADPNITAAKYSSLYVEKADFFKLDNLSVGYTFDISEDNKYLKDVRLSLSGQNLFTITSYTGADPEPALTDRGNADNGGFISNNRDPLAPGIDRRYNYFSATTITLGVNINF